MNIRYINDKEFFLYLKNQIISDQGYWNPELQFPQFLFQPGRAVGGDFCNTQL